MERVNVQSGSPFEEAIGFSRAVRVGERVVVSEPHRSGRMARGPRPKAQARRCLEIMLAALEEAVAGRGCGSDQDLFARRRRCECGGEAHREVFSGIRPASTMVVVNGLLDPRWKVEMELEAVLA